MANILQRFFRPQIEQAVKNAFNQAFFATVGESYTKYPTNNVTYLEMGFLRNPIVYSVVRSRADKAKSIPFNIKRVEDQSAKKKLDRLKQSTKGVYGNQVVKALSLEKKAFGEDYLDFPLPRPNELQTWADIISLYETFMCVTGNFYLYMLKGDFSREPIQYYVLPSHLMQIVVKGGASMLGTESPVKGYMLTEGNRFIEFSADEVLHIKLPNPEYGTNGEHLYGLSPLRAALRNIQSANTAIDNNIKTLNNSGAFGFIHGTNQALTEDQAKELKSRMEEMDSSPDRLSKIAGVSAEIGFTRLNLTTDELKPFDYLQYDQKQICNALGWDDKLLNNDDGAKYDNVGHAEQRVVTNTIMPSLKLLEEAFTQFILPMYKGYDKTVFEFDYSGLPEMQQDLSELVKWVSIARADGAIHLNEYREFLGLPLSEDPNMEIHTVKDDVIPLSEAIMDNFSLNEPQGLP